MPEPVIIIGGGVIGLSIGWHLARTGVDCLVVEKGRVGCEASNSAAGMITPSSEIRFGEEQLLELFLESLNAYRDFVKELEEASGLSVDFHSTGSFVLAIDHDDEAELLRLYDYQKELGLPVNLATPEKVVEAEPLLSPKFATAIEARGECFLDNRLLVSALKLAFVRAGGRIFENRKVTGICIRGNEVSAVFTGVEKIAASKIILAGGIHTQIDGLPDSLKLPIRPVKGQALDIKNSGKIRLGRAIRTIHRYPVYMVPRSDGRITVGATNEEMGMDDKVTSGAILDLLYGAWKIMPSAYDMEFMNAWTGHRPTSPDHSPILGRTDVDGLFVAMGMYRHGILLTPAVGKLVSGLVGKGAESKYFDTFGVKRFSEKKAAR